MKVKGHPTTKNVSRCQQLPATWASSLSRQLQARQCQAVQACRLVAAATALCACKPAHCHCSHAKSHPSRPATAAAPTAHLQQQRLQACAAAPAAVPSAAQRAAGLLQRAAWPCGPLPAAPAGSAAAPGSQHHRCPAHRTQQCCYVMLFISLRWLAQL